MNTARDERRGRDSVLNSAGDAEPGRGYTDLQLLGRLLVGLAYLGSEELFSRLRAIGPTVAADVEISADTTPEGETTVESASYLALGVFLRGQRRLARPVRRGLHLTRQAAGLGLGAVDRLTRNRLVWPLRRPVDRWVRGARREARRTIEEGRSEAHTSRLLAGRTAEKVVDDVLEVVIENPELMVSLQRLVRQRTAGLSDTVVSQTRQLTVSADDVAEGIARRLTGRGPRPRLSVASGAQGGPSVSSVDSAGDASHGNEDGKRDNA